VLQCVLQCVLQYVLQCVLQYDVLRDCCDVRTCSHVAGCSVCYSVCCSALHCLFFTICCVTAVVRACALMSQVVCVAVCCSLCVALCAAVRVAVCAAVCFALQCAA